MCAVWVPQGAGAEVGLGMYRGLLGKTTWERKGRGRCRGGRVMGQCSPQFPCRPSSLAAGREPWSPGSHCRSRVRQKQAGSTPRYRSASAPSRTLRSYCQGLRMNHPPHTWAFWNGYLGRPPLLTHRGVLHLSPVAFLF